MSPVWLLVLPFVGSVVAALFPSRARDAEAWLAGVITLAGLGITLSLYPDVAGGGVVRHGWSWVPQLGLSFALRVDGFAWMFSLLICGIGALVVLYARYYLSPQDPVPRFFSFLLAFIGAMLGIVLSGNLIQLVFFWELTSLFSFLLIGYWHHNPAARDGARMALIVTGVGGLCLLSGVLLVGHMVGGYDLDTVLASGNLIREHELYLPALILVAIGAFTKSAQFPFHFWLPHAMTAPTPVSAFLHSATMVKAGVFVLARLWPVMAGTDVWFWIVGLTGLATMLLGAYFAIFQQDLKGLLAYSTISHLGLITLLLGLDTADGAVAATFHVMNHATFKASLFMAAGVIEHETGTRDIRRLSGLVRKIPITAALAMVAAAAMAGVPLLNGFLSKEMFFAATIQADDPTGLDWLLPYVAALAGAFSVAYSLRFIHGVFFGPDAVDLPREPHEPPRWMRFPIEFLVVVCVLVGVAPALVIGPILATAVRAVLGARTPDYSLAIWHGFSAPLLMSAAALGAGTLLYLGLRNYLADGVEGPPILRVLRGQRIFERVLVTVSWRWGIALESMFGTTRLQPQLLLIVSLAFLAGLLPLMAGGIQPRVLTFQGTDPVFAGIWIVGAGCALGAALAARFHRLAALVLMGGAGILVCLTFVWLSAPDLAMTQLLVEIATTVLLLLGLRWLPHRLAGVARRRQWRLRLAHARDVALAAAVGLGLAVIAYAVMTRPPADGVATAYLERAYPEGGGKNVVNVILVDFRAFDTLGEITVLGTVAIAVFALLRRFRPAPDSVEPPRQQVLQQRLDVARTRDGGVADPLLDYMYIPRITMHGLLPFIGVLAVYLFLRGHDLPGGGFAAGITLSIAFILQYMAAGTRWVEERLAILPLRWMAAGLICAVLTGVGSWVFGAPFLTSHFRYAELPVLGSVPLVTALLFDLGVFLLVVGATTLVLTALAHQSIRGRRVAHPAEPQSAQEKPPSAQRERA